MSEIMTVKELAEYLKIHPSTVYRLCYEKKIPGAFKIGTDWRFYVDTMVDWMKNGCP